MGKSLLLTTAAAALVFSCGIRRPAPSAPASTRIQLTTAEALPDNDTVWITGFSPQLGGWNGRGLPMQRTAPHEWTLNFTPDDSMMAFKFTLGSWSREARLSVGRPFGDMSGYRGMDTAFHALSFGAAQRLNDGQVTGHLVQGLTPPDPKGRFPQRPLWIWSSQPIVPGQKYDLLLMSDGQNCFDPAQTSFGVDWAVDEAISQLEAEGVVPPTVVVGLQCSFEPDNQRRKEYGPGEVGDAYAEYLMRTVLPWAQAQITPSGRTYFAGSSMGGILGWRLMHTYPDLLDGIVSFSPAIYIEAGGGLVVDGLTPWKAKNYFWPRGKRAYFYNGGQGLDGALQPGIDQMLEQLNAQGFVRGKDYEWSLDRKANHDEYAWRLHFPEAYRWVTSN
ncbi:MAG: alpha/beta hydrolase-fold protein [Schleiferiaceae bacterium]